jgi:hypothetical protein
MIMVKKVEKVQSQAESVRTGAALQPAERPIQLPPIRPRREDDDVSQTSVINIFNDS